MCYVRRQELYKVLVDPLLRRSPISPLSHLIVIQIHSPGSSQCLVTSELKNYFRPEFINRIDEIIVFNQLTKNDYEKIAKLLIDEFIPSLRDKGIRLVVDEDVPSVVANDADGGVRGARDIRHTIRKAIEDPIANMILTQNKI